MKKKIFIIILLLAGMSSYGQTKLFGPFNLTVDLKEVSVKPDYLYIFYKVLQNGVVQQHYDSVKVVSDLAVFKGELAEPVEARISRLSMSSKIKSQVEDFLVCYIVPGIMQIKLKGSFADFSSNGKFDASHSAFMVARTTSLKEGYDIQSAMRKLDKKKDSIALHSLSSKYAEILKRRVLTNKQFVIDFAKKSPVALLAFGSILSSFSYSPAAADSLYNQLSKSYQELPAGQYIRKQIETFKSADIGQKSRDFRLPDTSGKMISLSSYRGKYVLLDFWASWCVPCRAESPALRAGYEQFKDKNFAILQVSVDDERAKGAWLKAIETDRISQWTHVSDLKGIKNYAAVLYGITRIPQNFLIDPSGKIIAKNLRGEELAKKLRELIK
ncbi:Peroxiredoxin [Pedobacter sp. ok626]|uniref:peroxiredoxin family protein n=1 Tax=Pedobacter sp. ok626 TaxID=1761882 RepID=UPI000886335E|nr:TlpA disulfide reductase family protein [Pedobacter sp. ok626]SDL75071.1 Peroxiredoxin [Pedobacter sp. ok626]